MRLARVLLVWACLLPLLPANAAGQYRVTLAADGSDSAALAKRLAAAYHAQLETPVDENGTFLMTLSAATAELLARDPLVARLEAPAVTPDASTSWDLGTYGYDHAGNIRKIGTRVFVYDTENRLSYETIGTQKQQQLTYDSFGNVRTISEGTKLQTVGANEATNRADVASSAANHMSGTYDGAGNMVTAVSTTDTAIPRTYTFTYDALNVVTASTTDASRAYVYNANDERIGVITLTGANGTEDESQWTIRDPGGQVLRRFSRKGGQWTWMQDYVYRDGKMLASESNDQMKTLHYHLDHLGSPRLITGNGGAELARHTYYPFGEEVPRPDPPVAEPKKFTGHERDKGGLDYMHARYYDYSMARFLSVDPTRAGAHARIPQSWNRYTYGANSPVNNVDPDGRQVAPAIPGAGPFAPFGAALAHADQMNRNPAYRRAVMDNVSRTLVVADLFARMTWATLKLFSPISLSQGRSFPAYPGADPTKAPGEEWEWRGPQDKGSRYNPWTGEALRPDLAQPAPIGAHWDYKDESGKWWRLFPDGRAEPKKPETKSQREEDEENKYKVYDGHIRIGDTIISPP